PDVIRRSVMVFFFFQAEDGIRDDLVTGVQTCALPISSVMAAARSRATRGRPPYFRAWTAPRAPASSQTAERTKRRASGHAAHRRQAPNEGTGWPQRLHHGARTGRQR